MDIPDEDEDLPPIDPRTFAHLSVIAILALAAIEPSRRLAIVDAMLQVFPTAVDPDGSNLSGHLLDEAVQRIVQLLPNASEFD